MKARGFVESMIGDGMRVGEGIQQLSGAHQRDAETTPSFPLGPMIWYGAVDLPLYHRGSRGGRGPLAILRCGSIFPIVCQGSVANDERSPRTAAGRVRY